MWEELTRRTRKGAGTRDPRHGARAEGDGTTGFAKPAPVPTGLGAEESTIRFSGRDTPYRQVTDVREYWFGDIRPEDHIIDIGANVGAFCIRAAKYSGHVVAVEPVASDILRENIRLNHVDVRVIEGALGRGAPVEITWDDARARVPTYTLRQIIGMAGGCDFLKCDCEGGEWLMEPGELSGIRRIEMELHLPPISGPPNGALLEYIGRHYDFGIERRPCHDVMGVMGVLHAFRRGEDEVP